MKKLWTMILAVSTFLIVSNSSATEDYSKAPRKDTVIFDIDMGRIAAPDIWNPYVPNSRADQGFHAALMEPLFILNPESGKIEPWLGESFTSDEIMKQWTLKLREGILWSDGEKLTADDVVFTVNMILNTPGFSGSRASGIRSYVKEVKKVDDLTILFILKQPNPRFQLDTDAFCILPEHIWENQDPLTFTNYDPGKGWPIFTGPYKLASVSETEFVYVRDDNWWGAKAGFKPLPKPKKLIWTWAGTEETRAALMAENALDSLMDVTIGTFRAIKARNPNIIAWERKLPYAYRDMASRNLEFNTTIEPWNDPEMRWAINKLIDRDRLVKIAFEGATIASKSPFPAYTSMNHYVDLMKGNKDFEKLWEVDIDGAQKIFESKGYVKKGHYYEKDGRQLALAIETMELEIKLQRVADLLVEMFQAAGINATHRKVAVATWVDNLLRGKFEAIVGYFQMGSVNEPWATLDTTNNRWLKPVGELADKNGYRWDNQIFSDTVDQIGVLPLGDPQIDGLVVTALTQYYKELPTIPLTESSKLIPFNTTYWTNWPTAENNYIPPSTWGPSTPKIVHNLKPAE